MSYRWSRAPINWVQEVGSQCTAAHGPSVSQSYFRTIGERSIQLRATRKTRPSLFYSRCRVVMRSSDDAKQVRFLRVFYEKVLGQKIFNKTINFCAAKNLHIFRLVTLPRLESSAALLCYTKALNFLTNMNAKQEIFLVYELAGSKTFFVNACTKKNWQKRYEYMN